MGGGKEGGGTGSTAMRKGRAALIYFSGSGSAYLEHLPCKFFCIIQVFRIGPAPVK